MALSIEKEVLKLTGEGARKTKETDKQYLMRVYEAIANLDEADWKRLSDEAQEWYSNNVEREKKRKPLLWFNGEAPDTKSEASEEGEEAADTQDKEDSEDTRSNDEENEDEEKPKKDRKMATKTETKAKANGNGSEKESRKPAAKDEDEEKPKAAKASAPRGARIEKVWEMLLDNPDASVDRVVSKSGLSENMAKLAISRFHRLGKFLHENGVMKKAVHSEKASKAAAED